ncbi:MAG: hypothetical protein ACTSW4_05690, partial [Candidatus Ranarchaeia archaeon]
QSIGGADKETQQKKTVITDGPIKEKDSSITEEKKPEDKLPLTTEKGGPEVQTTVASEAKTDAKQTKESIAEPGKENQEVAAIKEEED